jgi:hypothetical protein
VREKIRGGLRMGSSAGKKNKALFLNGFGGLEIKAWEACKR